MSEPARGVPLVQIRKALGLTQKFVAARAGVSPQQAARIENAPGQVALGKVADYVAGLGGRLELVAVFGGERVVIDPQDGRLQAQIVRALLEAEGYGPRGRTLRGEIVSEPG